MRYLTTALTVLVIAQISKAQGYDFVAPTAQPVYQTLPSTGVKVTVAPPKPTAPSTAPITFPLTLKGTIDKKDVDIEITGPAPKTPTPAPKVTVKWIAESGIFVTDISADTLSATVVGITAGCYRLKAVIITTTPGKDPTIDVKEAVVQIMASLPCPPAAAAKTTTFCPTPGCANLYCLLVVDENSKASSLVKNDAYWADMTAKGMKWAIVDAKSDAAKPFGSEPGLVVIDMNANGVAKKAKFPSNTDEMDRLIASVSGK